jgi:gliding motility-associated-like protein
MLRTLAHFILLCTPLIAGAQEVCNNALDDDNDGLIDLNDPDCECATLILPSNVESYVINHSFEERLPTVQGTPCCPYGFVPTPGPDWFGDCAVGWSQATSATSDYFHMCGFAPVQFPLPPPDGEGCLGMISMPGYKEYLGACIFDTPLFPGTEYTLSLWIAGLSMSGTYVQGLEMWNNGVYYEGLFPLALYGRTACVPFPMGTELCSAETDGWIELARVYHQPDGEWSRVSMTFTPAQEIRTVILGAACDLPGTYVGMNVSYPGPPPFSVGYTPYTLVDELILTESSDQVLTPVTSVGNVCAGNVIVSAVPPFGATDHQWYLDGVAIPGQTALTLNASALGLGPGTYTLASTFEGQCLKGSTNVAPPIVAEPLFALMPARGCAPLTVAFEDTTGVASASSFWDFGDGATATGQQVQHTYTAPGVYDVTLTIANAEGCTSDSTLMGAVVVDAGAQALITATPNPTDVENTTVELSASGSTGDIIAWWWDMGAVPPGEADTENLAVDFPAVPGTYPVLLLVSTAAGCVDTVRSEVVITLNGEIEMPNVFSPNGDGVNDRFLPMELNGINGQLEIYNRWGQLLFSSTDLARGWNGQVNGEDVPGGTYYFTVLPHDGGETRAGHLTLLR